MAVTIIVRFVVKFGESIDLMQRHWLRTAIASDDAECFA